MPVCRQHGQWPCLQCKVTSYKEYSQDNIKRKELNEPKDQNGKLLLHDLTALRNDIIELGGKTLID